jgi:hypothetical protein
VPAAGAEFGGFKPRADLLSTQRDRILACPGQGTLDGMLAVILGFVLLAAMIAGAAAFFWVG